MPEQERTVTPWARNLFDLSSKVPVVLDQSDLKRIWNTAWGEYLEDCKDLGIEDPRRVPPFEILYRKCNI